MLEVVEYREDGAPTRQSPEEHVLRADHEYRHNSFFKFFDKQLKYLKMDNVI